MYIAIHETPYRWFFDDPEISENDLGKILPFSEEYASRLWEEQICPQRHLLSGGKGEWAGQLKKITYNYTNDWNNNNYTTFAECLSGLADLPDDEIIVFFWCREAGLETTWGVFLKNWINFLYDDEAPILMCPKTGFAAVFAPSGAIYAGNWFLQA